MQLYKERTANYPRLRTDTLFADYENRFKFNGIIDETIKYIEDFQLMDTVLWRRFVEQFREHSDNDGRWRGEYWGKMMRGGCFVYSYTRNEQLYSVLAATIEDMMASAESDGRISACDREHEADCWDMWCRKYVLLGMQYFLEICEDEDFSARIISSMCRQADCIMEIIGDANEGKTPITKATRNWRGLNSSSLLEPIVRLYTLTQEKKYLDFAAYIVDCGGMEVANVFKLAYENELYPYQYPITKAYEMTSCFEGLLEYYRITGVDWYKTAIINFADKILESDFSIIGCCGCTHELFDHTSVRQANTTNGRIMQETCVTVTMMKFFYQLTLLTGDVKYVDAFETSMYNAYLGSVNTEKVIEPTIRAQHPEWILEPLPFDSYSPLTAGTRGNGVGGLQGMSDRHYYGCCACIGAAGCGLIPKMALLTSKKGLVLNLFIDGEIKTRTPNGTALTVKTATGFPKMGEVKISVDIAAEEEFELLVRNPEWSKTTAVKVNGSAVSVCSGYISIDRKWRSGDTVEIELDMRTAAIYPTPYGQQVLMNKVIWGANYIVPTFDREDPLARHHIALKRGPIILAQENRLGYSVDDPVDICVDADGYVDAKLPEEDKAPYKHIIEMQIPLTDGSLMRVTDYASAGKLWTEESKMAAWILTK